MKAALFILVVAGAIWYTARRFMEQPAGSFREQASEAAASVRKRGPGLVQDVAYGIEKAGELTESQAETLRDRKQAQNAETESKEETQ